MPCCSMYEKSHLNRLFHIAYKIGVSEHSFPIFPFGHPGKPMICWYFARKLKGNILKKQIKSIQIDLVIKYSDLLYCFIP